MPPRDGSGAPGAKPAPRKKYVVRKPARGPQGLPIQNTSPQADRSPAPASEPLVQAIAHSPAIKKAQRKNVKRVKARSRYSGDYPTAAGRTNVPDARQSPEYRDAVKHLLTKERTRQGLGDIPASKTPKQTPIKYLEGELALLRAAKRVHTQNVLHPFGKDEYKVDGKKVDLEKLAMTNSTDQGATEGLEAGVGKALEQTVRPLHAIAGGTDAALHGRNVIKAAGRGLANKDKKLFSDVLKGVGVPDALAGPLGFVGDVALDPTTYVSGGTGSIARKEAEKAAAAAAAATAAAKKLERSKVARPQLTRRSGLTAEEARAAARAEGGGAAAPSLSDRMLKRRTRTGDQRGGVTIKFAGKEIPGVRKATAKIAPRKTYARIRRSRAREAVADVNPNMGPIGAPKEQFAEANRATRSARSKAYRGEDEAVAVREAIRHRIGEKDYQRVADAIEAKNIKSLPPELQKPARDLRALSRYVQRLRKRSAVESDDLVGQLKLQDVPTVTAKEAKQTARVVSKADRAVGAAERRLTHTLEERGVAQGRAEVLSHSIAGLHAERAVEGNAKTLARIERAEDRVRTGSPGDVLRFIDAAERALHHPPAAGGHGVNLTRAAHEIAGEDLARARTHLAETKAEHEAQKVLRKDQTAEQRRVQAHNDLVRRSAKDYVPHILKDVEGDTRYVGGIANRTVRPGFTKGRAHPEPLAVLRETHPGLFDEDLPHVYAKHLSEGHLAAARSELNRRLADMGRPVPRDGSDLALAPGEAVYHIKGSNIPEIKSGLELSHLTDPLRPSTTKEGVIRPSYQSTKGGRFVVLNKELVDHALEGAHPQVHGKGIARGYDKLQGGFKALATYPNPSFHVRNMVGDLHNAYLTEGVPSLARNLGQAARALKHLGAKEEAVRQFGRRIDPTGAGLKINGQTVPYAEAIMMAEQTGAIRSGFTRELSELSQRDVTRRRAGLHRLKRLVRNREDVTRMAVFIGGLKRGMTPEKATERAVGHLFDYGHLTRFERDIARRAMPFYTWSARNIPLQTRTLVKRPGKFANYQKIREEAAAATGVNDQPQEVQDIYSKLKQAGVELPDNYEQYLNGWERKQAGIPIKFGDGVYNISAGMPSTDLGLLPGLGGGASAWVERAVGLVTPIVKTPGELIANYQSTFDGPIERDTSPLVAAPPYVGGFPDAMKAKLGIARGTNDHTGEEGWMWPGHIDYLAHTVPGPTNYLQRVSTNSNQGSTGAKIATGLGIRTTKVDPYSAAIGLAYERKDDILKERNELTQQNYNGKLISANNPTKEYTRLGDQLKLLDEVIYGAKAESGWKVLPDSGGPPKVRSSGSKASGGYDFDSGGDDSLEGYDFDSAGSADLDGYDFDSAG